MKTTKNLLKVILLGMLMANTYLSQAQIQLSFTGNPSRKGKSGNVGTVYTWDNVGTTGKITIQSKIEIIAINGGATLENIDNSSSGSNNAWQPIINGSQSNGDCWGIEFEISFYNASNGQPITLSSFMASGIDIDGDQGTLREYNQFNKPTSYTLEEKSLLGVSVADSNFTFRSPKSQYSGISITQTEYIVSCLYELKQSFRVVLGSCCEGGSCSGSNGNRLHSINMYDAIYFNNAQSLPISLLYFKAKVDKGDNVAFTWATASETNNDFFTVERSNDGINWETILTEQGAGNSMSTLQYSAMDAQPIKGVSFYRLKQTDFDGKFEYFGMEVIRVQQMDNFLKSLYPNPTKNSITIEFIKKNYTPTNVKISNAQGQVVMESTNILESVVTLDLTDQPNGVYFIEVSQNQQLVRSIVIKN